MIGINVTGHPIYPGSETPAGKIKALPVPKNPIKQILRQILTQRPIQGQPEKKIIQQDMIALEQFCQLGQLSLLYLQHYFFIRKFRHWQ
jgi:hypothetical protein